MEHLINVRRNGFNGLHTCPAHQVCGIPITPLDRRDVLDEIEGNIRGVRQKRTICITNAESMYYALRSRDHAAYIRQSCFSLCDGIAVVMAGLTEGKRFSRFTGPALVEACCLRGVSSGWRHFFYGGSPEVAQRLSSRLPERFPGLILAGCYSPPFRPVGGIEDDSVLEYIESTRPDILWVGLGLPKQERWIADHAAKLNIPWFAGVGAAFGYLAGTTSWAPVWVRSIGFEWLYRLLHEPPRMLPKVLRSLSFCAYAASHSMTSGFRSRTTLNAPTPESSSSEAGPR